MEKHENNCEKLVKIHQVNKLPCIDIPSAAPCRAFARALLHCHVRCRAPNGPLSSASVASALLVLLLSL